MTEALTIGERRKEQTEQRRSFGIGKETWEAIRGSVVVLSVAELAVTIMSSVIQGKTAGVLQALLLPFEVYVFSRLGAQAARQGKSWQESGVWGAWTGVLFGFIMATAKMLILWEEWTVFNLLTEPGFTALAGAIVSGSVGSFIAARGRRAPGTGQTDPQTKMNKL